MIQKKYRLIFPLLFCFLTTYAQQSILVKENKYYNSGLELLRNQKYAAAAQQFRMVEQSRLQPDGQVESNASLSLLKENAKFYLALCALELGNSDAEDMFLQFIKEYPLNPHTKLGYFYVGNSYFAQKNYTKALEWFEKTDPSMLSKKQEMEYLFKQGYSNFELNDIEKAEDLFEQVKNNESAFQESATYYFAYINYLNKEYKTALSNFEKLKGSPTYEKTYPYYITSMYYLDGRYNDVISYATPILETSKQLYETEMQSLIAASHFANTDYTNAVKYFGLYYSKDKSLTQNNLFIYQYGYALHMLGNNTKAIEILEKLSVDDVYLQSGMYTLGRIFVQTKNKEKARSAFFRASRLEFDPAIQEEAWFNYARLSYELEFNLQALESTQAFIKQFPSSQKQTEAKTLLGEILLTSKNYQAAIDILEPMQNKTQSARGAYQKATYYRGLEFYNERAFPNALSMFLRSANFNVDAETYALSNYWMAESMYELRKYGEAVTTFEKFLKIPAAQKTDVFNFANYGLGYAAFEDEKYSKAANYFERFLAGNDKDAKTTNDATLRLADAYFVNKSYKNALNNYNKIISKKVPGEDYALFQRGMIQGLENQDDAKIATMQSLLSLFPNSNYADDAGFEMAYTYFNKGEFDKSKTDLISLIAQYPRSSYIPRALVTIGLVQSNQDQEDAALESFKKVVAEYPTTPEAQQALESVKLIYQDRGDASGFLNYANTTSIGNLTTAEQDNFTFQAAKNRYLRGEAQGSIEAINAYYDKFPKPIHDKEARFIRAESLVKLNRPDEAVPDYDYILNDWTSDFTERSLISISKLFLNQNKYNEAIVYLKRLETSSDYMSHYSFAINNLLRAYNAIGSADDMLKYADLTKESDKASEEEKNSADLYKGKAYLMKADTALAVKAFTNVVANTKTVAAAEAKYNLAEIQYLKHDYKGSQKTLYELTNTMASYDYWVVKSYILLSDNFVALKDPMQARSTLLSIIDNYEGKDELLQLAKDKLNKLNQK